MYSLLFGVVFRFCIGVDLNHIGLLMLDDLYRTEHRAEIEDPLAEQRDAEDDHEHPAALTRTQEQQQPADAGHDGEQENHEPADW